MGGVGYSYNGYKGRYNENYKGCLFSDLVTYSNWSLHDKVVKVS